jgi:hypothetical protein
MYVLDFLADFPDYQQVGDKVSFEYRLLCSGELYNAEVLTSDWRKNDVTRVLFDSPFTLIVCSYPFNEYPQELALRFSSPLITEKDGQSSSMFHPDDDIARDLAALLTLLCRRLITVASKVREGHPRQYPSEPAWFQDWSIDFVKSLGPIHWEHKPSAIIYGPNGVTKIIDYNPPPLRVNSSHLKHVLLNLPKLPLAESLVLSARLYSLALQQLESDVDIAYQLLIAAVEPIATEALRTYTPTDDQMIATKESVAALALRYGLPEDQAHQLAIEACKGIPWASRKFTKFLLDNISDAFWKEDDLFKVPETFLPQREGFEAALKNIYNARGKLTHGGRSFPPSSAIGRGPTISSRVFMSFDFSSKPFPPAVWFERVVNNALNLFIERSLRSDDGKESLATDSGAT